MSKHLLSYYIYVKIMVSFFSTTNIRFSSLIPLYLILEVGNELEEEKGFLEASFFL